MRKLFLLIAVLVLSSLVFSHKSQIINLAFAQSPSPTPLQAPSEAPPTGINLTISPVFLNLVTDPGQDTSSSFRVTNNNNFKEYLEISVKKFVANPTGDSPVIQDADKEDEFVSWVSFSEQEFTVDPNQTKTIRFTINPPEEANLGYYYAFVVQRISATRGAGVGPAIAGSTALPVLMEVKSPNAKREVQIVDFKTDKLFYEYLPTEFRIIVKNTGNVHIAPSGDIFIDSLWNKEVGLVSANKGRGNILPDSQRTYVSAWDDGLIVRVPKQENGVSVQDNGKTIYETKFDIEKPISKFRFGRYTANLILVYDNGERDIPLEAQVSFWVIPWRLFLVVFTIILAPFILYRFYRRVRK
jgi:hypothetical protein